MMPLDILVLVKQVPDTQGVTAPLMTEAGIVNRAALPTITNPDDLCALEQALLLKDKHTDTRVRVLTMGPPSAVEVLKEALYRGATEATLLSDRAFAGADTLATSRALALGIATNPLPDLIFCGQQSLDGDTAQVGAQVAECLGIPQVTQTLRIEAIEGKTVRAVRQTSSGIAHIVSPLPCLLTVSGEAAPCRPRHIGRILQFKHAATPSAQAAQKELPADFYAQRPYLTITEKTAKDIGATPTEVGLAGSPTQVWRTREVRFALKANEILGTDEAEIAHLMKKITHPETQEQGERA